MKEIDPSAFQGDLIFYNDENCEDGEHTKGFAYRYKDEAWNVVEKTIGLNTLTNDMNNPGEIVATILHETQNIDRHKDLSDERQEKKDKRNASYFNFYMGINGFSDIKSDVSSVDWNNNNSCDKVFSYGNERKELDYKTYESLKGEKALDGTDRVKKEETKIGKIPLDILNDKVRNWLETNLKGGIWDQHNIEGIHEHIFFEDEIGGNIGFTRGEGFFSDTQENLPKYKITETGYNDTTVRQAIENIKEKYTPDNYKMFSHNCQNFVKNVREEYKKIKERQK